MSVRDTDRNEWAASMGLPEGVCRRLVNPGFTDPFDAKKDVTLDMPALRLLGAVPLAAGKLDWVMLRNVGVRAYIVCDAGAFSNACFPFCAHACMHVPVPGLCAHASVRCRDVVGSDTACDAVQRKQAA
eukprot:365131-Chlamydomonas_euryale.AAC.2